MATKNIVESSDESIDSDTISEVSSVSINRQKEQDDINKKKEVEHDEEKEDEAEDEPEDEPEVDEEDGDEEESESEKESEKDSDKGTEKDTEREECMYSFSKNDDESVDIEYDSEEDGKINMTITEYVKPEDRITKPFLTKYEYVRILGDRTKQLIEGAKPLIKNYKGMTSKEIAIAEIKLKMVPYFIHRPLPSGKIERWGVNELSILD